ncbi:MAG: hypothetical protein AMXMBFR13_37740 [Phycisphaerae bacterium]
MKMLIPSGMIGLLLTLAGSTRAAPLAYEFTGTVHTVDDIEGILDSSVREGSEFSGRFSFDTSAADLNSSPERGEYRGPQFSFALTVGTYSGSSSGDGVIFVGNDVFGQDMLTINGGSFSIADGLVISTIGAALTDNTASALMSDSIPIDSVSVAEFQSQSFFAKGNSTTAPGAGSFTLVGTLSTFNVVPEPALFAIILLSLAGIRARRVTTA